MAGAVAASHPLVVQCVELGFAMDAVVACMVRLADVHVRGEPCRLTIQHRDMLLDLLTGGGALTMHEAFCMHGTHAWMQGKHAVCTAARSMHMRTEYQDAC